MFPIVDKTYQSCCYFTSLLQYLAIFFIGCTFHGKKVILISEKTNVKTRNIMLKCIYIVCEFNNKKELFSYVNLKAYIVLSVYIFVHEMMNAYLY